MKRIIFSIGLVFLFQIVFAQTYDLLGPTKDAQSIITEVLFTSEQSDMKTKLKDFNFEVDGEMTNMQMIYKDIITVISDREVNFKLEKELGTFNMTMDGKTTKEKEKSPLNGKDTEFIKLKEKWSLKNPKKFNKKQIETLNEVARNLNTYFYPIEAIFPKSVKVGDIWEIKDKELAPIGVQIENLTGTATLTLKSVEVTDEDTIAIIGFETFYKDTQSDFKSSYQLKGTIKRSIKNYSDYKVESEGTYSFVTEMVENGMRATVTTKGKCNYNCYRKFTYKE